MRELDWSTLDLGGRHDRRKREVAGLVANVPRAAGGVSVRESPRDLLDDLGGALRLLG